MVISDFILKLKVLKTLCFDFHDKYSLKKWYTNAVDKSWHCHDINTKHQLADIFTKPLSEEQFDFIRRELGMLMCLNR